MFESIVIHSPYDENDNFDLGLIAETLLFYNRVHILVDFGSLRTLIEKIGINSLFRLVEDDYVTLTFLKHIPVASTTNFGFPVYDVGEIELIGNKDRKHRDYADRIEDVLNKLPALENKARHHALKLSKLISFKGLPEFAISNQTISEMARRDLANPQIFTSAATLTLKRLVPAHLLPSNMRFKAHQTNKGFVVETNVNFDEINRQLPSTAKNRTITPADLIATLCQARTDLTLASHYSSEFVTRPHIQALMKLHLESINLGRDISHQRIFEFEELVLGNGFAVKEAINNRYRTFDEFITLLDRSRSFKGQLRKLNPDSKLLSEYHSSLVRGSWIESLPGRAWRWGLFGVAGVTTDLIAPTGIATAGSLALGAIDTFMVDRLLAGWRPHYFVNNYLRDFVTPPSEQH